VNGKSLAALFASGHNTSPDATSILPGKVSSNSRHLARIEFGELTDQSWLLGNVVNDLQWCRCPRAGKLQRR